MTAPFVPGPRRGGIVIAGRGGLPGLRPGGSTIAEGVAPGPDTIKLDPYLFPPPFSTPINLAQNVGIVGAGVPFTALDNYAIPGNCFGVISSIDLLLDSILITSDVQWTITINGIPIPGLSPLTILGRNGAASVGKSWPGPLRVVVPLGGRIGALVRTIDGGNYTAGTSLYGWFWPQQRS